ncbi:MAG: hypothetical protein IAB19_09595 [Proteobacteria bacterium]|uniref:Uncharacterized protein n=1 Tax=Candidatus Avisuccinivibrio stercorigallinarum TaxID=2840704 RepID=A0A9D9DBE2_9GAMM|nr:hypothetical protein [Candidatus Avisuccinivibrio stercorigallinarum]
MASSAALAEAAKVTAAQHIAKDAQILLNFISLSLRNSVKHCKNTKVSAFAVDYVKHCEAFVLLKFLPLYQN